MNVIAQDLVRDANDIWRAGVTAVDSARLVAEAVSIQLETLCLGPHRVALESIHQIVVVGAGKAGAGMAQGLSSALGDEWSRAKRLSGWVNVPDDCVREVPGIRLFGARPPGENVPTPRVIEGTRRILELVRNCGPNDLCICLLSGGGSALLDLPVAPITLAEQIGLIEYLSSRRANIQQLNTVRKQISEVKAGRLAAACRAPLVALIISDVLGDPLDVIASGPTTADSTTAEDALSILREFDPKESQIASSIYSVLRSKNRPAIARSELAHVRNLIVGNLRIAVEAAAARAQQLGYQTEFEVPTALEGLAEGVGQQMVRRLCHLDSREGRNAWIEGGEPVVQLADPNKRGLGGRNQQVILAVAEALLSSDHGLKKKFCALSGGTDGEDGPTDAAGAWLDTASLATAQQLGLVPSHYLVHNDAYHFFERLGTLLRTGPTHTNVCDLRVLLCE